MLFKSLFVTWLLLATGVVILAFYRKAVARKDDEMLHVSDAEAPVVVQQTVIAKKLDVIDKWGKVLTVVAVVYGLVVLAYYLYLGWVGGISAVPE